MAGSKETDNHERERAFQKLRVDADDSRPARSIEEMVKEAEWLRGLFEKLDQTVDTGSDDSEV